MNRLVFAAWSCGVGIAVKRWFSRRRSQILLNGHLKGTLRDEKSWILEIIIFQGMTGLP